MMNLILCLMILAIMNSLAMRASAKALNRYFSGRLAAESHSLLVARELEPESG
jgi:hypothetical protein